MDGNNQVSVFLVGNTNDCNFNTIQEALDNVEENSVIQVKPGIYNEHLSFTKKVHLIGCNESIKDKSSAELPIVVLDSDKTCEIDIPVEIEGIIFTHKKDLQFDKLSSYIRTPLEFEEKKATEFKSLLLVNSKSSFKNIAILHAEWHGITFACEKASLETSFIYHGYSSGIYVGNESNAIINDCIIVNSNAMAIIVSSSATPKISFCKINKSSFMGIVTDENANPHFISCEIQDTKIAVNVKESSTGLYENCIIHNNSVMGIGVSDEAKPIIKDCEIFSSEIAINVSECSHPKLVRCEIYSNNIGIGTCGQSSTSVSSSDIYSNNVGIQLMGFSSGILNKCVIHDCKNFGIHLYDKDQKATVKNCVICKNDQGIIVSGGYLEIEISEIFENKDGVNVLGSVFVNYKKCNIHDNEFGIAGITSNVPAYDTIVKNNRKNDICLMSYLK